MSFTLARLKDDVSNRLSSDGSEFYSALLRAVYDVTADMQIETIIAVSDFDPDEDDITLDAKFYNVMREGVLYYLQLEKRFNTSGEPSNESRYRGLLNRMKAQAHLDADSATGMDFEVDE